MIYLNELLLQMKQDPFYGYTPIILRDSEVGATPATVIQKLVSNLYSAHPDYRALQLFKRNYQLKYYGDDPYQELLIIWCCFFDLPAYKGKARIDWAWQDYLEMGINGLSCDKNELKEFLRSQGLLLPVYFYYQETDNTDNQELISTFVVDQLGSEIGGEDKLSVRAAVKQKTEQLYLTWQNRLDELSQLPQHQGKSHSALCKIIADETIASGRTASTIQRKTHSPYQ